MITTIPLAGVAVLVADDDRDNRDLLALFMESQGAEVRSAESAAQAMSIAEVWRPDILLLDLSMPGCDGIELLRSLHAARGLGDVPAVAVTGRASDRDREAAEAAGFASFVVKPLDLDALVVIMAELSSPRSRVAFAPRSSGSHEAFGVARRARR